VEVLLLLPLQGLLVFVLLPLSLALSPQLLLLLLQLTRPEVLLRLPLRLARTDLGVQLGLRLPVLLQELLARAGEHVPPVETRQLLLLQRDGPPDVVQALDLGGELVGEPSEHLRHLEAERRRSLRHAVQRQLRRGLAHLALLLRERLARLHGLVRALPVDGLLDLPQVALEGCAGASGPAGRHCLGHHIPPAWIRQWSTRRRVDHRVSVREGQAPRAAGAWPHRQSGRRASGPGCPRRGATDGPAPMRWSPLPGGWMPASATAAAPVERLSRRVTSLEAKAAVRASDPNRDEALPGLPHAGHLVLLGHRHSRSTSPENRSTQWSGGSTVHPDGVDPPPSSQAHSTSTTRIQHTCRLHSTGAPSGAPRDTARRRGMAGLRRRSRATSREDHRSMRSPSIASLTSQCQHGDPVRPSSTPSAPPEPQPWSSAA
jgi:hypothetical protein